MVYKLFLIALAGGLGTLSRYGLAGLVQRLTGPDFPWGTFVVNIAGAFLFGFVWWLSSERDLLTVEARLIILTGFLGAFTTFSTYMFESSQLIRDGQWVAAAGNILGQIAVGIAALFLGFWLAKALT